MDQFWVNKSLSETPDGFSTLLLVKLISEEHLKEFQWKNLIKVWMKVQGKEKKIVSFSSLHKELIYIKTHHAHSRNIPHPSGFWRCIQVFPASTFSPRLKLVNGEFTFHTPPRHRKDLVVMKKVTFSKCLSFWHFKSL